jgi:hypothetical protein
MNNQNIQNNYNQKTASLKKRGELSLSVVVMAIIALIILLVLTFIVLRGSGNFTAGTNQCGTNEICAQDKSYCANAFPGREYIAIPKSCTIDGSTIKGTVCCRDMG